MGMFSSSNRAAFVSGVHVTQTQGGGEKKAGLVPSVAVDSWGAIFRGSAHIGKHETSRCCTRDGMSQTLVFTRNYIRPIGSNSGITRGR